MPNFEEIKKGVSEEENKMTKSKDLGREIRNAKGRLQRLKERRASGPEAMEALDSAPLSGASGFVNYLDQKIKEEEELIARLEKDQSELKG